MHKKIQEQGQKTVQLKQLVSQPQCLKLLILHTPFHLNLQSLHQCVNLVKLDLSKNNLASFPYLGNLPNLKFMFLHENKLDIDTLIGIFQQQIGKQIKSPLSKSVIWVTYWGNKSQFNARHYLVNNTSVLAVDRNMVVVQQRSDTIILNNKFIQPFDPLTDVNQILQNRRKFNKNATQQQYMQQFWEDMAEIRKKYSKINHAVKIQKVYRGWIARTKRQRQKQQKANNQKMIQYFFDAWKKQAHYQKKLKLLMKKKNKQYLLLPIKEMKLQAAKRKILDFVKELKRKILLRKMNLRCQYKFFNVLKSNQQALRSLYNVLHIDQSSYVMVHSDGIQQFKKYVLPVASSMNNGIEIKIQKNKFVYLRYLYEPPRKRRQFLRLLQVNQKSLVIMQKYENSKKIGYNQTVYKLDASINITSLYNGKNLHLSISDKSRMNNIQKSMQNKRQMELGELLIVNGNGNKQLMRDIVRGLYFYNMGYLTNCTAPTQKINMLSQYCIKRTTAILRIQKMWRGASFRKKVMELARKNYLKNRAAVKIQRWYRNLPSSHRKIFILDSSKMLKSFNNQSFYVKLDQYMNLALNMNQKKQTQTKLNFLQQNISPYISISNKKLAISWNIQSQSQNVYICRKLNKSLFTQSFLNKIFQDKSFINQIKYGEQKNYEKCSISHLFHYRTQVSLLNRKNCQYLQIKCASKYDCRLRVLALMLLTYQFNHNIPLKMYSKQHLSLYQVQYGFKKSIKNQNSIFVSQKSSQFEIQPTNSQKAKTFKFYSKFYISAETSTQKPQKFASELNIIVVNTNQDKPTLVESPIKKHRVASNQQKFQISNFLITDTNDIRLDRSVRDPNQSGNTQGNHRAIRGSLKNIKIDKRLKLKNRQKVMSSHIDSKGKYNFMLGDPHHHQRMTTQPDLLTQQRSAASIAYQSENVHKKQYNSIKNDLDVVQSRALMKKKIAINNEEGKKNIKNMEQFTKNFINQGNFIQSQFLYGQIKRMKTEIQKSSANQVTRVKTQQSQGQKFLTRFNEQRQKNAQQNHKKHRQQLLRSAIQKRQDLDIKKRMKNETRNNYKSAPRKMRINFAQQCYPIIGKQQPISQSYNN